MFGLGKLWGYLIAAGVAVASVLALMFTERKKGATTERAKQTEKIHEKVEKANKVRRAAPDPERKRVSRFDRE